MAGHEREADQLSERPNTPRFEDGREELLTQICNRRLARVKMSSKDSP